MGLFSIFNKKKPKPDLEFENYGQEVMADFQRKIIKNVDGEIKKYA